MAVADVFYEDGFEVGGGAGGGESGEGRGDLVPLDGGLAEDDVAEVEGVVGCGEDGGAGAAEVHEGWRCAGAGGDGEQALTGSGL